MKIIFNFFLAFLLLKSYQAQVADYVIELNCTSEGQCLEILNIIRANFRSAFDTTTNVSTESNLTGVHPIPELLYQDYDECDNTLKYCVQNANCINVFRTYRCECLFGYQSQPNATEVFNCTDIDECSNSSLHQCNANQQCVNTPGSYECSCSDPDGGCTTSSSPTTLAETSTTTKITSSLDWPSSSDFVTFWNDSIEKTTTNIEGSSVTTITFFDSSHTSNESIQFPQTNFTPLPPQVLSSEPIYSVTTTQSTIQSQATTSIATSPQTTASSTNSPQTKTNSTNAPETTDISFSLVNPPIRKTTSPSTISPNNINPVTILDSSTTISTTTMQSTDTVTTTMPSTNPETTTTVSTNPVTTIMLSTNPANTTTTFTNPETTTTLSTNPATTTTISTNPETTTTLSTNPATTTTISTNPETTTTLSSNPATTTMISTNPETTTTLSSNPATTTMSTNPVTTILTSSYPATINDGITTADDNDSSSASNALTPTTIPLDDTSNTTAAEIAMSTTTTTIMNFPMFNAEVIMNGDEDPANVIRNLSAILDAGPVNEDQAILFVQAFDVLASASDFVPSDSLVEVTRLAERLLNTMNLQNGSFEFRSGSVAVAAIDINGSRVEALRYSVSSGFNSTSTSLPSISLPTSLFSDGNQRVSFTAYEDASLFPAEDTAAITNETSDFSQYSAESIINSVVIGSALNGTEVQNLVEPIDILIGTKISFVPDENRENSTTVRRTIFNPRCVFFNYTLRNGSGDWSQDGCTTIERSSGVFTCECNHLTSFAVLMSVETRIDDHILTILTYVGCSLSIFGLLASILTYSLFRHLRKHKSKQILLHFCFALCGVYIVYIFGITAALPSSQAECTVNGFFLHFFTSATFAWMFIEVLDMYLLFVKVWSEITDPVKKACLFGWGFPLLLSIATLGAHFGLQNRYPGQDVPRLYPEYRQTTICWLSTTGLYWAFFLPMGIILTINLILFFIVLYHVTCKRANSKLIRNHSNTRKIKAKQHLLNALAILLLTGPTWIIGFFINIDPIPDGALRRILAYIFVIANAFQGLWIFIVFTVRPQAVRTAWWNLITGKSGLGPTRSGSSSWGRRFTKTSSTYLSRANRRKSSNDIRRSSASSSVNAFKISASGKLQNLEVNPGLNEKTNISAIKYRYTASPELGSESRRSSTSGRNSNSGSDQNLVTEEVPGKVNPAFNTDEQSSTSS